MRRPLLPLLVALATPGLAAAAEVQLEGAYRARARGFSSLSLATDLDQSEGFRAWVQHRLWVKPRVVLSEQVALHTEIRGLDGVPWGARPAPEDDPTGTATGADTPTLPRVLTDDLRPPPSLGGDGLPGAVPDISLWRAYGEVHGELGTFRFGRMPVHWGLGVWQNDGHGLNADFGDSVDRVQWDRAFGDLFVRAAFDVDGYGLASDEIRDTVSGNLAGAFRTERVEVGVNAQVRHVFPTVVDATDVDALTLATASLTADAELGNLRVGAEVVGRYGDGALDVDRNDVQIRSLGGVLVAELAQPDFTLGLEAGFATGDRDPTDSTYTTFVFDRDYNIGILLFEQPMPIFRDPATNRRDLRGTLSGNGIANALFGRVRGTYALPEDLTAEASVSVARTFFTPEDQSTRTLYGVEGALGLSWRANEHVDVVGTAAGMVPGSFYTGYRGELIPGETDGIDITDQSPLDGIILGGQILGRIAF